MESVSEAAFLVTELGYTIGQVDVQLHGLDVGAPAVQTVLMRMIEQERTFQRHLGQPCEPASSTQDEASHAVERFVRERERTIARARGLAEPWPFALLEAVRRQAAHDRRCMTEIAEACAQLRSMQSRS